MNKKFKKTFCRATIRLYKKGGGRPTHKTQDSRLNNICRASHKIYIRKHNFPQFRYLKNSTKYSLFLVANMFEFQKNFEWRSQEFSYPTLRIFKSQMVDKLVSIFSWAKTMRDLPKIDWSFNLKFLAKNYASNLF